MTFGPTIRNGVCVSVGSTAALGNSIFPNNILPETTTLINAMTVRPSNGRIIQINQCITALIAGGVWAKCDIIYMLAAHDAQAARLNWKTPASNTLAVVNSPVFQANKGYTGDGVSALLTASYTNTLLLQNDAHISAFGLTSASAGVNDFSLTNVTPAQRAAVRTRSSTLGGAIVSSSTSINAATSTDAIPRMLAANRTVSTDYDVYSNGVFSNNIVNTSTATVITAAHFLGNGVSSFSNRQIAFGSAGGALTALQHASLYSAVRVYLQAVRAV